MKFKETNYKTVLDRIFIRIQIDNVWQNISLGDCLAHQDNLKRWLHKFSGGRFIDATPEIPLRKKELIDIIKWLDGFKPPVRLKE